MPRGHLSAIDRIEPNERLTVGSYHLTTLYAQSGIGRLRLFEAFSSREYLQGGVVEVLYLLKLTPTVEISSTVFIK